MKRQAVLLSALTFVMGVVLPVLAGAPAQAASGVGITNEFGSARIDSRYSTKLTISGNGFQSVRGGHGGVYVWFGTVGGNWKPSQGGISGQDYKYVPDNEAANNQGFQRYIAFPGSDTAASAAAVMSDSGSWRVTLTVPGPTFKAVGRSGAVTNVDCRVSQCGVITVGAHGVKNANNETFTPVSVADLYSAAPGGEEQAGTPGTTTAPGQTPPVKLGKPKLEVDRTAAVAGRVVSFTASGITPGKQVSVVFDDGQAAAGPFQASDTGEIVGVISLPLETTAGTHELRVYGLEKPLSVKFAVRASDVTATTEPVSTTTDADSDDSTQMWGKVFAGFAAGIFVLALARVLLTARRSRREA